MRGDALPRVAAGEEWWDLCAGPHVEHTGQLPTKAIELETVAGAYWRGDENRQQLQRIYGTAWENGRAPGLLILVWSANYLAWMVDPSVDAPPRDTLWL
jgi:hypothetical protein